MSYETTPSSKINVIFTVILRDKPIGVKLMNIRVSKKRTEINEKGLHHLAQKVF